ncbi:MAG TPA: hypothetical protein VGL54_02280 [Solirubrobacteraceae bacterium]|jgi:hypothetical protein
MNAHKLVLAALVALCTMAGSLLFAGAPAQAAGGRSEIGSFGPEGPGSGEFAEPQSIAVEQGTEDVYVYEVGEGGRVYKFNAAGDPEDLSSASTNVIEGVGGGRHEAQIAVDNSNGPDKGDIYVATGEEVLIYSSTGAKLATLTEEEEPCGVAVGPSGAVYVAFYGEEAVKQYTPVTNPVSEADYTSSLSGVGEVCNIAADSAGDIYVAGYNGGGGVTKYEASQFNTLGVTAIGTAVDPNEEAATLAVDPSSSDVYIDEKSDIAEYTSSGTPVESFGELSGSYGVAEGHESGDVYVAAGEGSEVAIYGPVANLPEASTGEISELQPMSVTLNGTVNPDGAGSATCQFEYGTSEHYGNIAPCSESVPSGSSLVAVSAKVSGLTPGTAYHYRLSATNANGTSHGEDKTFHTSGPPRIEGQSSEHVGNTSATIKVQIDPEGLETQYHVEYGTSESYGASAPIPDGDIAAGFSATSVSVHLTGLALSTSYHFRVVATNPEFSTPVDGPDQTFTTLPAVLIDSESVGDVADTSATLQARINPLGSDTHYYFQYGAASCSTGPSACADVPSLPGGDLGSGESEESASVHLQGLTADTIYYYRVVVSNTLGTIYGVERRFTTQTQEGEGLVLPDGRAWEMVSPPNKNGATISALQLEGGVAQAAAEGGAFTWAADAPIGTEPAGGRSPEWSQIFSTRGPDGWSSRDIAGAHESPTGLPVGDLSEYKFFSSDLSLGLVEARGGTPLSPEATEKTPYLRDDAGSSYLPLVTAANVPPGTKFGGHGVNEGLEGGSPRFRGATPDLSHVVLDSPEALTSSTSNSGPGSDNLYEWAGGQLQLVSVLPKSEGGTDAVSPYLGNRSYAVRPAISSDGSRIIWTAGRGSSNSPLYMREMVKGETIRLDVAQEGVTQPGEATPQFQTMSEDGHRVFFTGEQKLTKDSGATYQKPDLYEFETTNGEDEPLKGTLTDLTVEHSGESADVEGLLPGVSEDGSYVYLVAKGVLSEAENAEHEKAASGANNLYVLHDTGAGWTTTFIAQFSNEDAHDWYGELEGLTSRVSPHGRYLAFMSDRELTGYDNHDANSGVADEEVFLYDASTERLVCASCDPTGAQPVGIYDQAVSALHPEGQPLVEQAELWLGRWLAANIPGWTPVNLEGNTFHQSRYLSDSGRLFFNSSDALVPQDVNGTEDLYEYEPPGVGSCAASSVTFSERSGGCVDPISSGTSSEESVFLDASENGGEVFFLTAAKLVPQDYDTSLDIYDARECTVQSPCVTSPVAPPECTTADACRAASTPQPTIFGAPSSATFSGAGNPAPAPTATVKAKAKPLTRAQELAKALKACKKKPKKKRTVCEKQGRKRYGASKAKKKKSKAKKTTKGRK